MSTVAPHPCISAPSVFIPKSEVSSIIRALGTTDTLKPLKPLMKTEKMEMEFQTHFHVLKLDLSEPSGSQCISGFQASTRCAASVFRFIHVYLCHP